VNEIRTTKRGAEGYTQWEAIVTIKCLRTLRYRLLCSSVPPPTVMPRRLYPPELCAALKNGKECKDPKCSASHFYRTCEFCRKVLYSDSDWQGHVKGQKHRKREAKGRPIFNLNDSVTKTGKAKSHCPLCQTYVPRINAHNQSMQHWRMVRFHELKKLVEEAKKDKCGVVVQGQFDFDVVERKDAEKGITRAGSLRLTSSDINVTLLDVSLGSTKDQQKQKQQVYVSVARFSPVL
jgi:hypothetical protein